LDIHGKQISDLTGIERFTSLTTLDCSDNDLNSLDIKNGNNSILLSFDASNNPSLQCIQVDNATAANTGQAPYTNWKKDATATYSEDCASLGIDDELLTKGLKIFPNPVKNTLTIESELPLTKVEIYSVLGQKIKEIRSDFNTISTNGLTGRIYLIRIFSENGVTVRKLIKQQ
ncbi:MAG: T9SS type A sorting domain-containing protein, partial [Bacteroidales bacterium]|nr:T9SS type A sorting domain-containing protein [Bacteroidales bacterium]